MQNKRSLTKRERYVLWRLRDKVLNNFDKDDFLFFRKKFCGVFISRGKKAYAMQIFNFIMCELKKKFRENPSLSFYKIAKNVVPFFVLRQKKFGKRIVYLPALAKGNKKNRFMLDWLVRQLRGRSNVRGVKKEDLLNLLFETYKNKGSAVSFKREYYKQAIATKSSLRRRGSDRAAIFSWLFNERKKQKEKEERMMLLSIMTEEEIKKYLSIKKQRRLLNMFFRGFRRVKRKRKTIYKELLVK